MLVHPVLNALPATRRAILDALKRRGALSAEALSASTALTLSGIRQHLTALERDGLVSHAVMRHGPGRPRHDFTLTDAADALYPRAYAELTNELLDYVRAADPDLLDEVFARRARRRLTRFQAQLTVGPGAGDEPGPGLGERVQALAGVLDEDGYLAEWSERPDGSFRLVEHNCAVLGVAVAFGQACQSELVFLRAALPGAGVERVAHMLGGQHVCAYQVTPGGAE